MSDYDIAEVKAQMVEPSFGFPFLELTPSGMDFVDGIRIYLQWNKNTGHMNPIIDSNNRLSGMSSDMAESWGNIFYVASLISKRKFMPWFSESVTREAAKLWERVDELLNS